jgi:gliding motility associated protien GldN
MKVFKYIFIAILFVGFVSQSQAQYVLDGVYQKEHTMKRRVIPYSPLREGDVMWLKRVWRRIDLREKMNHVYYYPVNEINDRRSMFDVIKNALIFDGTLTAYDAGPLQDQDEFTQPMTVDDVKKLLMSVDTMETENEYGEWEKVLVPNDVKTSDIKWYDIKEEWFFDNQRSVMDVRIIGICPMKEKFNDFGESMGPMSLFWIYYPEARRVFANQEVFNRQNDAERRTLEDLVWKRQFSSYILKETNVYDRFIGEYKTRLDALLEAEKIKEQMFFMEHDVWSF